ncbi:Di-copper centre-containing protein [Pluteus cervinus]|uniref:Di-copper centre-containing protein n=1 Tax=Pluteus cervinus TaxID=181527 RepID=A0ACD3B8Y7_9AGAR|nr:Di-copper centre-containing protein [Pluteus cervinus]
MSTTHYIVKGVTGILPSPPRKNFNDFARDTDVLNLYLLALDAIQHDDQSKLISFFQIAGIHGQPYVPWDGVKGQQNPAYGGYCTHGSVIFPTWHRPYVALLEQVIWERAASIANSYTNAALKLKYQNALKILRQPYYDWAANTTLHPLLSTTDTVSVVNYPNGETKQIKNPLLTYHFNPKPDPSFTGSFKIWPQTLRYPSSQNANAHSQPKSVQQNMDAHREELRDRTFNLLAYVNDWVTMSNHTSSGESLESIHDTVHVLLGGAGHMSSVPVAAFDPIFWLHHTNVDRLVALWQGLNPTLWVVPGDSGPGSLVIPADQQVNTETPLTPFHKDNVNFWSSTASRDTQTFGYTYPELIGNPSPEQLQAIIMGLYGPEFDPFPGNTQFLAQAAAPGPAIAARSLPALGAGGPGPVTTSGFPNIFRDWFVDVTLNPHEFPSSGYVHFFLGETVPSGDWSLAPERVGDFGVFRNTSGQCENCNQREAAGQTITGHIPLTRALLNKEKEINSVDGIEGYLKKELHWRCELVDGTELPLEKVPSLLVKVYSAVAQRPQPGGDDREGGGLGLFPTREEPQVHRKITHGRVGGFAVGQSAA